MTDTAALQAQLDALKEAYRMGASTVSYEGKTTTFRTMAEMREAIYSLQQELGIAAGRSSNIVVRPRRMR